MNRNTFVEATKPFAVNEYNSWLLSKSSPHNAIIVAKSSALLEMNTFQSAVQDCVFNEPNLKLSISPLINGFIDTKNDISINFINNLSTWRDVAENELDTDFNAGEVLLRVSIVRNNHEDYVILCFHHIICDGKSIINFMVNLFNQYNTYLSSPLSLSRAKTLPLNKYDTLNIVNKVKNLNRTKTAGIVLSSAVLDKVKKFSKLHGNTVNSIMSALIISSYYDVFRSVDRLNLHFSIDLRYLNDIKSHSLKFDTSWIDFGISKNLFNNLIANIDNGVHDGIANYFHYKNLARLEKMIVSRRNDDEFANSFFSIKPTVCISNCGKIDAPSSLNEPFTNICELHLVVNCQSYINNNESFTITIATIGNTITMNVCYPSPLMSDDMIYFYIQTLENAINDFASR